MEIRKLKKTDNIEKAANLIYQTDRSLSRFLFGKCEKAVPKLKNLILLEHNSFSYNHIFCFVDDQIQGILLGYEQKDIDENLQKNDFSASFSNFDLFLFQIKNLILNPILRKADPEEFYIQNICIDSNYRRKGIGSTLLENVTDYAKTRNINTLSLDVSIENKKAKRLYERIGFRTIKKNIYPFSNLGVYRMKKDI